MWHVQFNEKKERKKEMSILAEKGPEILIGRYSFAKTNVIANIVSNVLNLNVDRLAADPIDGYQEQYWCFRW